MDFIDHRSTAKFIFKTSATDEKARIDDSGNILTGKTSSNFSTAGAEVRNVGQVWATRDGGTPLALNRLSSDGTIAQFYKDGGSIGVIAAVSGDLAIYSSASGHAGLRLGDGWVGSTNNAGTLQNGTVNLGTTAYRWNDLFLSGDANVGGNATITGDLTVNGTTTTLNTATLDVEDKNITLNYGAGDTSSTANGAGITIQDAVDASNNATILWDATNDEFDFSHPINVTGAITSSGTSSFDNIDLNNNPDITWGSNELLLKSRNAIGVVKLAGNGTYKTRLDISDVANTSVIARLDPVGGSSFLKGNWNLTTGALQTNGVTRIANNGNATLGTISSGAITSSGNVILSGTGNKDVYLGVSGSTEAAYISRYNNDFYLMNKDSGDLIFGTNNANKGRFTAGGDFQIGTTTVIDSSRNITAGTISAQNSLTVQNSSAYGSIEVGGVSGGFIDIKRPFSDDYDLRLIAEGDGGVINVASGELTIQRAGSAKLATTSTGIAVTGDATFADNGKALFGAGSDLQIYHDGSGSYISDTGTGPLRLQGSGVRIVGTGGENLLIANETAEVTLLHNNSAKLATTSTGIDVTGTAVTDGVTVAGDYNQSRTAGTFFTLTDTTNSKTGYINWESDAFNIFTHGPVKRLTIDSSGIDVTGTVTADGLTVDGLSQLGTVDIYDNGALSVIAADSSHDLELRGRANQAVNIVSNGTSTASFASNGDISFYEDTGTTAKLFWDASAESLGIGDTTPSFNLDVAGDGRIASGFTANGGVVFNENSADVDFRVESDSNTHALFVQGSSGNVGIGTSSPIANSGYANLTLNGNTGGQLHFTDNDVKKATIASAIDDLYVQSGSQTIFRNGGFTSGDEAMRIDSSGRAIVGKTVADNGTVGITLFPEGVGSFVADGSRAATFVRKTSDGDLVQFRKNTSTVGSVGVASSELYFSSGNTGLYFDDVNNLIRPTNSSGALRDNTVDLGKSDSRFKDLYLSGTITSGAITSSGAGSFNTMQVTSSESAGTSSGVNFLISDTVSNQSFTGVRIDHNASGSQAHTGDNAHYALFVDMDTSQTGGNTTNENRAYGIYSDVRGTGDTDLRYAVYGYSETQHSSGTVTENAGVFGYGVADDTSTGHTANNYGGKFLAYGYNTGSGGTTNHYAVYGKVLLTSANDKNTNSATGVYGEIEIDTSGAATTLSNGYVFQAQFDQDSSDTTVNNGYLFYGNYAGTLPTNAYGIYIADNVTNYFGGNVGIGLSSNIDRKLHVENNNDYAAKFGGTASGDFAIEIGQSSTNGSPGFNATAGSMKFSMAGTEAMRLDSSGNLLVGQSATALPGAGNTTTGISVSGQYDAIFASRASGSALVVNRNSDGDIQQFRKDGATVGSVGTVSNLLTIGTSDAGIIFNSSSNAVYPWNVGTNGGSNGLLDLGVSDRRWKDLYLSGGLRGDTLTFKNLAGSERTRIDASGNQLWGKTAADNTTQGIRFLGSSGFMSIVRSNATAIIVNRIDGDGTLMEFRTSGTTRGSISISGSTTSYNTTSDERAKENIVDAPSASNDIDAIRVRSFDFKADGSHQKYGMVAQELSTVAPEAVSVPDDADEMQSVDYSKLVPMMLKEIQTLRARVAQLEGEN